MNNKTKFKFSTKVSPGESDKRIKSWLEKNKFKPCFKSPRFCYRSGNKFSNSCKGFEYEINDFETIFYVYFKNGKKVKPLSKNSKSKSDFEYLKNLFSLFDTLNFGDKEINYYKSKWV